MSLNIKLFCDPDDSRTYLSRPFQLNGRTIACNGHILLSMPEHGDYEQCPDEYVAKLLPAIEKARNVVDFVPLPDNLVFPETKDCPYCLGIGKSSRKDCQECEGAGEVYWNSSFHDYEAECQTCDGDGIIITVGGEQTCSGCMGTGVVYGLDTHVEVLGLWINPKYLKLIINEPGLEVSADKKQNKLAFRSGENYGLIMGILNLKTPSWLDDPYSVKIIDQHPS
ncbi:MAG: hypothetical protein WC856_13810 [Methylococcaceae bacterium]|jgi:hypothetical protein